jgi:hypothetical protein
MAPHLRKATGNPLPAAPAGVYKDQFARAMAEAARQVTQALGLYCDCYRYTGSSIVGERLAEMGIPDHICAAAEIVCEVADEEGMDPGLCPADGSVSPEHVAAVLGWLKVSGEHLPEEWLGQFAWHEDKKWFIHPEHSAFVETSGLPVESPEPCHSFKRPEHDLPIDPPAGALLFASRAGGCPTVCVVGETAYADPVNVLPEAHQPEVPLCGREWTKMTIAGVPVEVRSTGGDGLFMGVAVDTGQMMRFNLEVWRRAFHFPLEEAAITCG